MIEVRDYMVYQIVDPRDDLPFYVGYTADIQARMRQHLAGDNSNDAKSERIAELQALGLAPLFEELETLMGTMTDARQRESYWIRTQGSAAGVTLLNTGCPLDGYERTKRGYALREDLVKECKQVALDTDRLLYEVMEECLQFALQHKDEIKAILAESTDL